jgi:hypothetical protein
VPAVSQMLGNGVAEQRVVFGNENSQAGR